MSESAAAHRRPPRHLFALLLLLGVAAGAGAEPACSRATVVGASCEIALDALHPTQSSVGMIEVEERAAHFAPHTDFIRYTRNRPMPVVQSPDGMFYLTDGHHTASVLQRLGAHDVVVRLIGRFDDPSTFWQQMRTRHWVYLFDRHGRPISPSALPQRIADMRDDPYRSLASYAERAGYFQRTSRYFQEFDWARYFGERMGWQPIDRLHLLPALETAAGLACLPAARDLPGYKGPCRTTR